MRKYETLLLFSPELVDTQLKEAIDRNKRLIEKMGGEVREVAEWGVRDLAYRIRKFSRGSYVLLQYTAKPDVVLELDRTLKIADDVLRFITVAARDRGKEAVADPQPVPAEPEPTTTDADNPLTAG